jgi:hypothetical protein
MILLLKKIVDKFNHKIRRFLLSLFLVFITVSCSVPAFLKTTKVDPNTPINAQERARKNIEEGKGVSLKNLTGGGKTTYEFSSSNPLWRASLETIDFMPLTTVDYSGGIIITDWYSDASNQNESIKITLRFLSNDIRSESVKVIVHKKKCSVNENCKISELNSKINFELHKTILAKASKLEIEDKKRNK